MATSPTSRPAEPSGAVRGRFESDAASRNLGIEVIDVAVGKVVLELTSGDEMMNAHGIMHGGYLFTLGDTCAAYVCESLGAPSVSRHADITFIAPASRGARLRATGTECTRYGRNTIVDVRITDDDGRHIAEMRVFSVVRKQDEEKVGNGRVRRRQLSPTARR